jgi:hypothetical protein
MRDKLTEPLLVNQFAYQSGKPTEHALHLVTKIEKAIQQKEVTLCAFLDIEEAFDSRLQAEIV